MIYVVGTLVIRTYLALRRHSRSRPPAKTSMRHLSYEIVFMILQYTLINGDPFKRKVHNCSLRFDDKIEPVGCNNKTKFVKLIKIISDFVKSHSAQ